jgi:hypothetical protein
MTPDDFARVLKAKRTPSGWIARCPSHDARTASLSIGEGKNGQLLLKCHAGCGFASILKAAGVEPNGEDRGKPSIVATYTYRDALGKVAYQVVRLAPKDFRQRKPDGNGRWIWKMDGVERVPYRLPALLNATEVYICEGEKDCDNLAKLGLAATSNPGGADRDGEGGKKWPESFGRWFQGRHAILIPDNDEGGRRHVQAVARKLHGAPRAFACSSSRGCQRKATSPTGSPPAAPSTSSRNWPSPRPNGNQQPRRKRSVRRTGHWTTSRRSNRQSGSSKDSCPGGSKP